MHILESPPRANGHVENFIGILSGYGATQKGALERLKETAIDADATAVYVEKVMGGGLFANKYLAVGRAYVISPSTIPYASVLSLSLNRSAQGKTIRLTTEKGVIEFKMSAASVIRRNGTAITISCSSQPALPPINAELIVNRCQCVCGGKVSVLARDKGYASWEYSGVIQSIEVR